MRHRGNGASGSAAQNVKALGNCLHLVAMVHPDLQLAVQAGEQFVRLPRFKARESVFALFAFPDTTFQDMRHQLLAVADTKHGSAGSENSWIDLRAARFVNAIGTAGDDNALTACQLGSGSFAWFYVGVHAKIANLPGDEMTILAACIQDGNLWRVQSDS